MPESKTPQFDTLLDKILDELVSHTRICLECKKKFEIEKEDIILLKMFRSPAPKLCPNCRQQRRLSAANYSNIYKRKCDVPGHSEILISPVAPIMPWVAYDYSTYYSDTWDARSYSMNIDITKSFFEQYLDLARVVPIRAVPRGAESPNSDFSFYGKYMKDCYYVFGGRRSENIMFGSSIYDSKSAADCYFIVNDENVYDNITTSDCYKCAHAYFCSNCIDCDFIYDCRNCQNCFGCVNLRNKNYCWFNKQLTKEEYKKRRAETDLGSQKIFSKYRNKFWDFLKTNPVRATRIFNSPNSSGNDIKRSKNCQHCFQAEDSENIRYGAFAIMHAKDSMDIGSSGGNIERLYECQNVGTNSSNIKFSFATKESSDSEYLMTCTNCHNCFGCIGLKNGSYMIFNKQYEPKEYWKKVDEIKTRMLQDGSYGEYFSMIFSPCAYNGSFASFIYPITEGEAKKRGIYWQPETDVDMKNLKSIDASKLPDNVSNATDELCNLAIIGEISKKPFKLTPREIKFYKQNKIALPIDTPHQRIVDRYKILNNFQVSEELCDSCGKTIESAYKKSDDYRPYCDECYKKEIL